MTTKVFEVAFSPAPDASARSMTIVLRSGPKCDFATSIFHCPEVNVIGDLPELFSAFAGVRVKVPARTKLAAVAASSERVVDVMAASPWWFAIRTLRRLRDWVGE